jgi:hypothetical protein
MRADAERRLADLRDAISLALPHELRTPLNGIIGFAELLKDDAEDEDARENAGVIEKSGRHLLNLVNTILDVAKIEAGAMSLVREAVDIRALVAEVAAIHQSGAAAKGLDFQVSLADDLPQTLWIDPVRVRQVLHNLLSNAVKFTPSGHVHTAVLLGDNGVALRVSDSGPGIAEDLQSKIFEKFHQGDAFLTRSHGGTGLGLTLARHLVELMGGKMELDSVVGRGSVFIFTLPVDPS